MQNGDRISDIPLDPSKVSRNVSVLPVKTKSVPKELKTEKLLVRVSKVVPPALKVTKVPKSAPKIIKAQISPPKPKTPTVLLTNEQKEYAAFLAKKKLDESDP